MGAMSQHRPEDLNVDHESGSQYENRSFGERTPGPDGSRSHHDGTPGPDENRSYHEGTPSPDENRSSYGETQGYDDNRSFHEGTLQQENPNYDEDGMSQNSYANQCYHDDRGTPQNQDDEEMTEADEDDNSEVRAQRDLSAQLLVPLIMDLDVETGNAMFACGGSIPISESAQSPKGEHFDNARTAEPVTIRWDPPAADELARHAKLVLPLEPETEDNLERLIKDTEPASFGYKGKDVYNEDYRKALKMDTNAFATTVDPHSLGIIDTLAQVLRPTTEEIDVNRAVKAELYKLNIYSGPSGKFKAHVDTPRSNGQFGSLVICLPLAHDGGQLQVRHKGRELTFDWGAITDAISWAAFYSDCEHEVLEVTSGHRITLTYNLYAVRGNGTIAGDVSLPLDIAHLPFYQTLQDLYSNENFLRFGGHLGFYCNHAYPHTGSDAIIIHDMLKGVDMMVLKALWRLKLAPKVKPVLELEGYDEDDTRRFIGRETGAREENLGTSEVEDENLLIDWIDDWRKGEELAMNQVHWIGLPSHPEIQMSYIAYGNQGSLNAIYSYCAIIAYFPPYTERMASRKGTPAAATPTASTSNAATP